MANTPKGLLVAGFNYSMVDAGEFNDWYDTEHLPERQRCQGFINAVRIHTFCVAGGDEHRAVIYFSQNKLQPIKYVLNQLHNQ